MTSTELTCAKKVCCGRRSGISRPHRLNQLVVGLRVKPRPPARLTIEYLDGFHIGDNVLNILRIAQTTADAVIPYKPGESRRVTIYSVRAEYLADGLLQAMPVGKLPPSLEGARLEVDLVM